MGFILLFSFLQVSSLAGDMFFSAYLSSWLAATQPCSLCIENVIHFVTISQKDPVQQRPSINWVPNNQDETSDFLVTTASSKHGGNTTAS